MSDVMILKTAKAGRTGVVDIVCDCKDQIEQVRSAMSMVVTLGHDGIHPNQPDGPDPDTILRFLGMLESHLEEAASGLQEVLDRLAEPETPKEKRQQKI